MNRQEIEAVFNQSAPGYDRQWARLAPFRQSMHLLMGAALAELPPGARVLCVGAGTGAELIDLAGRNPGWRFVAADLSRAMIDVCRAKAESAGVLGRCAFHVGPVETLPAEEPFDAATALLVSQFLTVRAERVAFFRRIGERLRPGGVLVWSDLSADTRAANYRNLLGVWWRVMRESDTPSEGLEKMNSAYEKNVAILPPEEVAAMVSEAGFGDPVAFYRAGLIQGWFATWR